MVGTVIPYPEIERHVVLEADVNNHLKFTPLSIELSFEIHPSPGLLSPMCWSWQGAIADPRGT